MSRQIYVNLPVKNLDNSINFFSKLGFTFNERFTDNNATCMIVSDKIFVMLLVQDFFKTFTNKEIADATKTSEVLVCISVESKEMVDEMVKIARAAGGSVPRTPVDHGFMYIHGFEDLEGHIWELIYMREETF